MRARDAFILIAVAVGFSGCIGTGPIAPVTTEAQAIGIAKERCTWTRPFDATERWHAALHQGQWHVWLVRDIDPKEPAVGVLDIRIRASDGQAGSCNSGY
jgi:hypothetical protein